MTNKVFDVEAPEAVRLDAAGDKKAPAVVYGGICNWDAEDLLEARESFEREYLRIQIRRFSGNISKTAGFIGMERSALHRKLKLLGMNERNSDADDD